MGSTERTQAATTLARRGPPHQHGGRRAGPRGIPAVSALVAGERERRQQAGLLPGPGRSARPGPGPVGSDGRRRHRAAPAAGIPHPDRTLVLAVRAGRGLPTGWPNACGGARSRSWRRWEPAGSSGVSGSRAWRRWLEPWCTPARRTSWRSRLGCRSSCCRGRPCRGWWGSPRSPPGSAAGAGRPCSRSWCSRRGESTRHRWCSSAIAPLLWLVHEAFGGNERAKAALAAGARIGLLAVGVSAWWLVGVRLQGAYGLPVLQLTENLETVATGLHSWRPVARVGQLVLLRPRSHGATRSTRPRTTRRARSWWPSPTRCRCLPWPPSSCSGGPTGPTSRCSWWWERSWRSVRGPSTIRARMVGSGAPSPRTRRSGWPSATRPRAVPAGRAGPGRSAGGDRRWHRRGALAAGGRRSGWPLGLATLLPVWQDGYLTDGLARDEEIPAYWHEAAAALDDRDPGTRRPRDPGLDLRGLPVGHDRRPDHPRPHRAPVHREGGAARRHARDGEPAGGPRSTDAARDLRAAGAGAGGPAPRCRHGVAARRPGPERTVRHPAGGGPVGGALRVRRERALRSHRVRAARWSRRRSLPAVGRALRGARPPADRADRADRATGRPGRGR